MRLILSISLFIIGFLSIGQTVEGQVQPGASEIVAPPQTEINANELRKEYHKQLRKSVSSKSKDISKGEQEVLDGIVDDLEEQAFDTYDYHYYRYINDNYNPDNFDNLQSAFEISRTKTELYDEFVAHYEIVGNKDKKQEFCKLLNQSSSQIHKSLIYNYNVLQSLEPGAILFVNGFIDTYPAFVQQEVYKENENITILNLDFLLNDEYRKQKFKELKLKESGDIQNSKSDFVQAVAKANPDKPLYLSLTIVPSALKGLKDNLYLTGLAYKYSPTKVNNIKTIENNYNSKFRKSDFEDSNQSSLEKKLNRNYLPMLLQLAEYYKSIGNEVKYLEVKKNALKIAVEANIESKIKPRFTKME